jgi:dienelactone hydrolase
VILDEGFTIPPMHEGVSYAGVPGRFEGVGGAALSQSFSFYGRHQPYGLYVPTTHGTADSIPAALVLHGHGGSHVSFNEQPGFLRDMGEGYGEHTPMYLMTPLARGSSFYADYGEADALAVLDDVLNRFAVDRERLYITGYSMGGYGTYRLAALYPDRFAAAAVWAGYTGEFTGSYATASLGGDGRRGKAIIGNPVDALENLAHLPLVHLAGTNDEIVPTTGQYAAPRRLAELGLRSRFDLYPGYEHLTFALVDDWKQARGWLGNRARESEPQTITYKFSDGWTAPGLATELGLVHDGAWWLRGLTMRETTEDGLQLSMASATSHALERPTHDIDHVDRTETTPTPHVQQELVWSPDPPHEVMNMLTLSFLNVGTATIDLAAAGLELCGLELHIVSDGPVTVSLSGETVVGPFDGVLTDAC